MPRTPRSPTGEPNLRARLLLLLLLATVVPDQIGTTLSRRRRARRGGDDGVETVEIAIGIALGVGVALLLWAAYKVVVQKYLDQLP
ncbi:MULTISPECIES: hypothetical protein [unclassified Crossiella]|uniref:hypothetical protein n=1 Tax=unclassified Crossiella TaxID=2620835 RepID=UPI001FFEBB3F|nr:MULTISPECIES: hypothetical protein [unclassified Crossiella]MCK2243692.1 hypothetical protein [Crossiella sp. S99.2]MCK2257551.1 hypothetical protein [Crossiella sp. S99.1]